MNRAAHAEEAHHSAPSSTLFSSPQLALLLLQLQRLHQLGRMYRACKVCQQDKHLQQQPAGMLVPLPVPEDSWDFITADRITSLPKTKTSINAILVMVDRLTKMAHFIRCKNDSTAHDIARLLANPVSGDAQWHTIMLPDVVNKQLCHIMRSVHMFFKVLAGSQLL